MSPKLCRNMLSVFLVLYVILSVAKCHTGHGHYSEVRNGHRNQMYRHSRARSSQNYGLRRGRTDLDNLLERLNITEDGKGNGEDNNNLDSVFETINNSVTTTTERLKPPISAQTDPPHPDLSGEEDEEDQGEDEDTYDDFADGDEDKRLLPVHHETQADSQTGYRSPISERKWKTMSSRTELDKLFDTYRNSAHFRQTIGTSSLELNEALTHTVRVTKEGSCKIPRPKVIRVADRYKETDRKYRPSCTILHQCSEDSGCCTGTQKCSPKRTEPVMLYFYVSSYVYKGPNAKATTTVERLKFDNHTECECQDYRDEQMPRDSGRNIELQRLYTPEANCRCPSEYTVRHLANGSCICDCFDKQRDCIKYKKGKEYFNHRDRLCIEMETCLQPSCDFGVYNRRSGRCPRKHEKFRTFSRSYS